MSSLPKGPDHHCIFGGVTVAGSDQTSMVKMKFLLTIIALCSALVKGYPTFPAQQFRPSVEYFATPTQEHLTFLRPPPPPLYSQIKREVLPNNIPYQHQQVGGGYYETHPPPPPPPPVYEDNTVPGLECRSERISPGRFKFSCEGVPRADRLIQNKRVLWLKAEGPEQIVDVVVPNYEIEELIQAAYKDNVEGKTRVNVLLKRPLIDAEAQRQEIKFGLGPPKVNLKYEPRPPPGLTHFPLHKPYQPIQEPILPPYDERQTHVRQNPYPHRPPPSRQPPRIQY